jgi:hypothetical protein
MTAITRACTQLIQQEIAALLVAGICNAHLLSGVTIQRWLERQAHAAWMTLTMATMTPMQ